MLNHVAEELDTIKTIEVGFSWNSNIKRFVIPFSIQSIVEEFTEPATNVEGGRFVKVRPMSTLKEEEDEFVGTEEEMYVRHPETYTFYKYYKNKGARTVRFVAGFPPHSFSRIDSLIELGLGNKEEVNYQGRKIKPLEFVSEVLKNIKTPKGYKEDEDLWLTVEGKKNGKHKKIKMQCLVKTIKGWEFAGCNIDTGLTIAIIARMVKEGIISKKGSFAPEAIIPPVPFFKEIRKRGMKVYKNGKEI
jgi:lysine 6-dehydrogenase